MKRFFVKLALFALIISFVGLAEAKDCLDKFKAEWCFEGYDFTGYEFNVHNQQMKLFLFNNSFPVDGKASFTARVSFMKGVIVVVDRRAGSFGFVDLVGFTRPPDPKNPDRAVIHVGNKNIKLGLEAEIAKAKQDVAKECYGCKQLGIEDPRKH